MNEQDDLQVQATPYPARDDRVGWQAYWQYQGQLWRSEAEIDSERQRYIAECHIVQSSVRQDIYSFKECQIKNVKLNRADVEWGCIAILAQRFFGK